MPGFDIESYKANFVDASRQNLFYFIPNFPPQVIEGSMSNDRATYLVRASQLPGTTLEEIMLNWQGFDFKIGGKHTYADITVTFNLDSGGLLRMNFENWINMIHNPLTNEYAPIATYMMPQRLQLLGLDGEPTLEYTLHHAWPKEAAAGTLDMGTSDVTQFDVTFSYAYHTISTVATGA